MAEDADLVRLTYATGDSTDVAADLRDETFVRYLQRSKRGAVSVGDEWEEVVNDGCGTTTPVTLTVSGVSGGDVVGETTQFEFTRDADR